MWHFLKHESKHKSQIVPFQLMYHTIHFLEPYRKIFDEFQQPVSLTSKQLECVWHIRALLSDSCSTEFVSDDTLTKIVSKKWFYERYRNEFFMSASIWRSSRQTLLKTMSWICLRRFFKKYCPSRFLQGCFKFSEYSFVSAIIKGWF